MSQIATLVGGAGSVTNVAGLSQLDEFILIGDVDTVNPLQGFEVSVNGASLINIQNQALITGYAKWLMETVGSAVGLMLKVSTGRIKGNTVLRFTNSGATTPAIYAFSDSDNGLPFIVATETILAGTYSDFSDFSALIINAPANLQSAIVTFRDGFQTTMSAPELAAYFSLENQAEADGYLGGNVVVDNRSARINNVRVFSTGANLNVLVVKLPNV
jgi:hypothetical protein